jgi:hypothetical protein
MECDDESLSRGTSSPTRNQSSTPENEPNDHFNESSSISTSDERTLHAHLITLSSDPHQKVIWLHVPMDEGLRMNVLHPAYHLICQHQNSLQGEATGAEVEEILQRRSQQLHHEHVVFPFLSEPSARNHIVTS